ncbi:MAG: hypothetical protein NT049_19140 [Planctomycetota bacterium]|nr:hypothetical protein [Planctomycetota bacterium]
MDDASSPERSSADSQAIEGYSFGTLARIAGMFCFLIINPLGIWIWIDHPKFYHGTIDGVLIFMAIITIAMESLGVAGLMTNFAKTRVTTTAIEWKFFRRHRVLLCDIRQIVRVFTFRGTTIMRLATQSGHQVEICAGTEPLQREFNRLEARFGGLRLL